MPVWLDWEVAFGLLMAAVLDEGWRLAGGSMVRYPSCAG